MSDNLVLATITPAPHMISYSTIGRMTVTTIMIGFSILAAVGIYTAVVIVNEVPGCVVWSGGTC
jgi:hypothetical protein